MSFRHKVCLVVGGTRGLGCAIARRLYEQNAVLVITGRNQSSGQSFIHELGENAFFFPCDITIPAQIRLLFDRIESTFGMLHCAVNNAGISVPHAPVCHIDLTVWRNFLKENLTGPLHCLKRELSLISRIQGGAVVNVSSCAGIKARASEAAYAVNKMALNFLTRVAAIESAEAERGRYAVRINAVAPGPIMAGTNSPDTFAGDHKRRQHKVSGTDMKRMTDPWEIAEAVSFLLSDRASYMTGRVLDVDGGCNSGRF